MLERISSTIDGSGIEQMVLNTGRNLEDTLYIAEAIATVKLRWLVLEHGAYAFDRQEGLRIDLAGLALKLGMRDTVRRFESLKDIRRVLAWYREDGQEALERKLGYPFMPALEKEANLSIAIPEDATAEMVIEALTGLIGRAFSGKILDNIHFCHSAHYVDVIADVYKSDGALILCRHLGIDASASLVMGDGMNDLEMFEKWGRMCCPSNSHPAIIKLCRTRGGYLSTKAYGEAALELYGVHCTKNTHTCPA